jgi:hypothetical protein
MGYYWIEIESLKEEKKNDDNDGWLLIIMIIEFLKGWW